MPVDPPLPAALAQPPEVPGGQHVVDLSRFWWVPAPPARVWLAQLVVAPAPPPGGGSTLWVDAQVGIDPEMPVLHGPVRR